MSHSRPSLRWALATLALMAASFGYWLRAVWSPHLPDLTQTGVVLFLLTAPSLFLILLPIWARHGLDAGDSSPPKGELEHLLVRKHQGSLAVDTRKRWDSAAKPHVVSAPGNVEDALDKTDVLDRLVQMKRHGRLRR